MTHSNYGYLTCPLDIAAHWRVLPLDARGMLCAVEVAHRLRLCGAHDCDDLDRTAPFWAIGSAMARVAAPRAIPDTERRIEGACIEIQHWIAGLLTLMPLTPA